MVFISRLKLRNFKSFKAADIQLPRTYICFAGPNGSGKSNLCDAIRFAMGETSLRSLRARNSKELIHTDSKTAEATLVFEGDDGGSERYEIKRAIRQDGKMLYRMNGKKVTRMAVLEALKKHNLDESGRNTIAQGEVQRILNMNGKERRTIIDSVAGIADFEAKKKEALGELGTVETRIKDAQLVLGERKNFLDELGHEKEVAIRFTESKKSLTNAKGTLLRRESERFTKELSDIAAGEEKIEGEKRRISHDMAALDAKVNEVDFERKKTSLELQSKQKTNELIQKVEKAKAAIGSREQMITDKKAELVKLKAEMKALDDELDADRKGIDAIENELHRLRAAFEMAEKKLNAEGGISEDESVREAKKHLEAKDKELASLKERLIGITSEIASKRELISAKNDEEKAILKGVPEDEGATAAASSLSGLRSESASIAAEIESSFSRTKEINAQMGELDREMLELKEKASIFKVRSSPHLANPALSFVKDLSSKDKRIKGMVADLISFEPKFGAAVEAAAGSRLLYVVVDTVDAATETIDKLKKAKAGRATFIPLDRIKTPQRQSSGKLAVIDVISYPEEARAAMEYVFSETMLMDDIASAKKAGIGTSRMVTLDGEIFERSGVISGGRTDSGILSGNQLRKIENELMQVKSTKDSLLQELYSIREAESRLRAEKSQVDIRIKTIEMETKMGEEKRRESEQRDKRREQIRAEIKGLEETIASRSKENIRLASELDGAEKEMAALRKKLAEAEDSFKRRTEETSKKRADLSAEVSSLRATIEGKMSETGILKKELNTREERAKAIKGEEKTAHRAIEDAQQALDDERAQLGKVEDRIASASKEVEKLFSDLKAHEQEFTKLGALIGAKKNELERLERDRTQFEIKKASAATRLDDMKAELANYQEIEVLTLKKDELAKIVAECEKTLAELGNVNMAAIEMYDKKKAEIDEVEERIKKLDLEREAIMAMINEIEEHKKDSFFETFQAVSDNFSKMFQYIQIGQGHLYLDKPATPFESGMFIKIRRNNKDYSLDALSGGERTLVALMFIFAMQLFKPSPFYILDEVDSALDKPNSQNLAELIHKMANNSQFIVVSHNDIIMSGSDSVIGVAKVGGTSKLVGVKLKQVAAA